MSSIDNQLRSIRMAVARMIEERIEYVIEEMDIPSNIPKELSLRESHQIIEDGNDTLVGSTMPYAKAVEYGRPAGSMPPVSQLLIEWVISKLKVDQDRAKNVAWAVATKIKNKGIEPQPYFTSAVRDTIRMLNNE